jgi:hypothetical protein
MRPAARTARSHRPNAPRARNNSTQRLQPRAHVKWPMCTGQRLASHYVHVTVPTLLVTTSFCAHLTFLPHPHALTPPRRRRRNPNPREPTSSSAASSSSLLRFGDPSGGGSGGARGEGERWRRRTWWARPGATQLSRPSSTWRRRRSARARMSRAPATRYSPSASLSSPGASLGECECHSSL